MDLTSATREEIHKAVYNTRKWINIRRRYVKNRKYRCENCGDRRKSKHLILHHRKPIKDGGDAWNEENLELLCCKCHYHEHPRPEWMREPKPTKSQLWKQQLEKLEKHERASKD